MTNKPHTRGPKSVIDFERMRIEGPNHTSKEWAEIFGVRHDSMMVQIWAKKIKVKPMKSKACQLSDKNKRTPTAAQYDEDERPIYDGIMIGCPPLSAFFSREVRSNKAVKY